MPAKAGIQYAAAIAIEPQTLWDTGSPPIAVRKNGVFCTPMAGTTAEQALRHQRLHEPHRFALRGRRQLALPHHALAAHERADRPAFYLHAVIGRPARARGDPFVGDGLFALQV